MLNTVQLSKHFGNTPALQGVSFALQEGEILAVLGPSGCGKSTLLKTIAGLETPTAGQVRWGSEDITHLPPEKRHFSLVFQDYALFPHLNVLQNVMFGLIEQRIPRKQATSTALQWLERVNLQGLEHRRVTALSGGQQQRVSLARALAVQPRLLLLDEPLSNLDQQLREEVQDELATTLQTSQTSTLLVTHDQQEAFKLASRVLLMRAGQLVQQGSPQALHAHPQDAWVAEFLGHDNVFPDFFIPQHAFRLDAPASAAQVVHLQQRGGETTAQVQISGQLYTVHFSEREAHGLGLHPGQWLPMWIDPQQVVAFSHNGGT